MKKIFLFIALIFIFAGCLQSSPPHEESVTFTFEVTDGDLNLTEWEITTHESTVGAALLAEGLITGDAGALGLFVTSVNGIVADWNADESWWAFYVDGEMSLLGVDGVPTESGRTYAFVYTRG